MSLTDVMSGAGLGVFPSIALVIFLGVFVVAVWRAFSKSGASARAAAARLPLEDAPLATKNRFAVSAAPHARKETTR
ncbi:MAG: hypothetical protein ACKVZJ_01955 [Phycisphaerales bacterium]